MSTLDKILYCLKSKGKNQKQLAEYLGISSNVITDWKSGRISSYDKYIVQIADFLNVSTDYLLGTEKKEYTTSDEEIKFALFKGLEGVTDEMYDEVKQFAEMVKMREDAKRGKKQWKKQ